MKKARMLTLFAATLFYAGIALGQTAPKSQVAASAAAAAAEAKKKDDTTEAKVNCPSVTDFEKVLVNGVFKAGHSAQRNPSDAATVVPPVVQLGDTISVEVENLDTLLTRGRCLTPRKTVVLFLDGRPLKELQPYPPANPKESILHFQLQRREASRDNWTHLLGKPTLDPRKVSVSVGFDDDYAVPSDAIIMLNAVPNCGFYAWLVFYMLLLICFWMLAVHSDVLRDAGADPANNARKSFSLARVQIAFWFFLIVPCYLFIGIVTGDFATSVTPAAVGLMGISGSTYVLASIIEKPVTQAPGAAAPAATLTAPPADAHWYMDILSDGKTGVSFHRFQMATWTAVLGIVFVQQVYQSLAMPDFSATLLSLMGISSGTYLSLKSTLENK